MVSHCNAIKSRPAQHRRLTTVESRSRSTLRTYILRWTENTRQSHTIVKPNIPKSRSAGTKAPELDYVVREAALARVQGVRQKGSTWIPVRQQQPSQVRLHLLCCGRPTALLLTQCTAVLPLTNRADFDRGQEGRAARRTPRQCRRREHAASSSSSETGHSTRAHWRSLLRDLTWNP
jgi:hypothetical protein